MLEFNTNMFDEQKTLTKSIGEEDRDFRVNPLIPNRPRGGVCMIDRLYWMGSSAGICLAGFTTIVNAMGLTRRQVR